MLNSFGNRNEIFRKMIESKLFLVFTFFFYCMCAFILNWDIFKDNDVNRMRGGLNATVATIESIVERRTFAIDKSEFVLTVDKMKVGEHFYSDKAPGFALLLSPVYFMLYKLGLTINEHRFLSISILTIFGVVIPAVLSLIMFTSVSKLLFPDVKKEHIYITRVLLAFGTIMVSFSGLLNYHLFAALLLMSTIYIILSGEKKELKGFLYMIGGFLSGLLFTMDIPTGGIFLLLIGIYLIILRKYKKFYWLIIGAAIPVLIYEYINYSITSKLLPPFFFREDFYQFEGSIHTALSLTGEEGTDKFLNKKRFCYIFRNFVGSVGLFSLSPILILASIGYIRKLKLAVINSNCQISTRFNIFLMFAVICQILFYNCVVPSAVGSVYGVRHILPVLPFLMMGFILFLEYCSLKKVSILIITISIIFSLGGAFQHKENMSYTYGWRILVPAYSFFHSVWEYRTYGE